jgi:ElaA protein
VVPPTLPVANVPAEIGSGCPSIGRVCNAKSARGTGIGRELMQRALQLVNAHYPGQDCQIGAQSYLRKFYESLQFVVNGDEYLEDGIPHFPMRWYAQK